MGIIDVVKKTGEKIGSGYREEYEFRRALKAKLKAERRVAFTKQAIISSRESAKAKAKRTFNPPQQKSGMGRTTPEFDRLMFGGSPPTQKAEVRKVIKKTKKRGKARGKQIRKAVTTNDFDIFKL